MKLKIDWPMAVTVMVLAGIAALVILFAPPEYRAPIVGLLMLLTGALRSFLAMPATQPDRIGGYDTDDDERDPTPAMSPRAMERRDRPPGDHSRRGGWAQAETLVFLAASFVLALGALIALSGCGATAATRSRYSIEVSRCLANERDVIEREGTSEQQDRADFAAERARCDAALAEIEGSDR